MSAGTVAARKRQQWAERKRRERSLNRRGLRPVRGAHYSDDVTEMLVDLRWLREDEWHHDEQIGAAISDLLADAAADHMKKKSRGDS
jgi:hypothetical protein